MAGHAQTLRIPEAWNGSSHYWAPSHFHNSHDAAGNVGGYASDIACMEAMLAEVCPSDSELEILYS